MPKVEISSAKGLEQVTGSGYAVSTGAFTQVCSAIAPSGPVYTFLFGETYENGSGESNADDNKVFHDTEITLYDADGTAHLFVIDVTDLSGTPATVNGVSSGSAANTHTDIAIAKDDAAAAAVVKIGKGIAGKGSDLKFAYKVGASSGGYQALIIYALGVGAAAGLTGSAAIARNADSAVSFSHPSSGTASDAFSLSVTDTGAVVLGGNASRVASLVATVPSAADVGSLLKANGGAALSYLNGVSFGDGEGVGQQITLINASSNRGVAFKNSNIVEDDGSAVTNGIVLAAGAIAKLVWTGAKWTEHPRSVATISFI